MKKIILILLVCFFILGFSGCQFNIDNYQYEDEIWRLIGQDFETVDEMTDWIYHNIAYMSDKENHGKWEYFQSPYETVSIGYGDCEDYAALYMYLLYLMTGEKSTMVVGIDIHDSSNNHAMVEDSHHDYLLSPQVPTYKLFREDYSFTYDYDFDYVMKKWTNYGNKNLEIR